MIFLNLCGGTTMEPPMTLLTETLPRRSRLVALLDHFAVVEDPRDERRILHPLPEILLLVVCGTIADCDDYEDIAAWGAAHIGFLRKHLPYAHGVPGERWLTILMNRINPALFAAAFEGWVRESWPEKAGFVAIDGKTSRRSHDRGAGAGPLHLVSAFATTARLVLAAEAVPDKAGELAAIPLLLDRLGTEGGLKDALVSIDAIATNAGIARAIAAQGADWLLAVKANQPTLRAEVEAAFAATEGIDTHVAHDKGHGRIEHRRTAVLHDTDWLEGPRRFAGEMRLPGLACLVRAETTVEVRGTIRNETRYFASSRPLSPEAAAQAVREHWAIENRLHWVLDVTFAEDLSRLRKGHGARNMATVRHFALNLVRTAADKRSIKSRRKLAGWDTTYLAAILASSPA
jgi:predicted transposase YbfD/YdcC